mmetsp:Transcript_7417/g.12500  ORF Transcript_7417/g.12500 Transcript_7417/m.12500 type:complete len:205 (+) Transcript_7417:231-845(+)
MIQQGPRDLFGGIRGDRNLVPILTGITRAGHPSLHTIQIKGGHIHERHSGRIGIKAGQDRLCRGALQRQERAIGHFRHREGGFQGCFHAGNISGLARGIDHEEHMIAPVRQHQVIFDAALVVGKKPIALAVLAQAQNIDGDERLQPLGGGDIVWPLHNDLTHVADVKKARFGPGVKVFFHHAKWILHRHCVAGKGHHLGPEGHM